MNAKWQYNEIITSNEVDVIFLIDEFFPVTSTLEASMRQLRTCGTPLKRIECKIGMHSFDKLSSGPLALALVWYPETVDAKLINSKTWVAIGTRPDKLFPNTREALIYARLAMAS